MAKRLRYVMPEMEAMFEEVHKLDEWFQGYKKSYIAMRRKQCSRDESVVSATNSILAKETNNVKAV